MIKLLGCLTALSLLCGFHDPDPLSLRPIAAAMTVPGVTVTWGWEKCGFINAWYSPRTRHVTMCEELKTAPGGSPGFVRYVFAHEVAHSVIIQRDLAFTGSSEGAADEFAAFVLVLMGRGQDVLDGAAFWLARSADEDPLDPHLGDIRRAYGMVCIVATSYEPEPACDLQWDHVAKTWLTLLRV